jgi:hypothetical protein
VSARAHTQEPTQTHKTNGSIPSEGLGLVSKMRLLDLLKNPTEFFESTREEDWRAALKFFLQITIAISIVTPVVNYLGVESTDFSSAYQAQILSYHFLKNTLLGQYGTWGYVIEAFLIAGFALAVLVFLTGFLHLVCILMGGKGPILNAWKAACYGVGPCILGGFLPYVSLFAGFYSAIIQFYVGPKVLYGIKESRGILFLAFIIASAFIEILLRGTTVPQFK